MTSQPASRTITTGAVLLLLASACGSDPMTPQVASPGTANPLGGAGGFSGMTAIAGTAVPEAGAMAVAGQGALNPMLGSSGTSASGASGASGSAGSAPQGGVSGGGSGSAGTAPTVDTMPVIYWLDINSNRVMRSDDFMTGEAIVTRTGTAPDGVAVDVPGGKVYWTNMGNLLGAGGGSLQRANLDGSGVETIIPAGTAQTPKQMQLDLVNQKLYFCDREGAKVWRAELDGSNPEAIVSGHGFQQLVGVALDVPAGKFYFSDRNGRKILRANIAMPAGETGANRTDIEEMFVFGAGAMPIDLDIDHENKYLYWTDRQLATVNRAGLDIPSGQTAMNRNDAEELVDGVVEAIGLSLDVRNGKMYYSELGGTVSEAALDGSGARDILRSASATGVAVAHLPK